MWCGLMVQIVDGKELLGWQSDWWIGDLCKSNNISIQAAEDKTIATRVYKWNCRVAICS